MNESRSQTLQRHNRDIEDITGPHVNMNFIFECSTRYLTSERSERVRCRVEHEKKKLISTSGHVIFCLLLLNILNDEVFDNFPKISDHFPKISEDFTKFIRFMTQAQSARAINRRGKNLVRRRGRRYGP